MKAMRFFVIPVSAAMLPAIVYATNGMNLEGYGPEALGMGGASMAYDNGSAAVMNNPATIGLMPDGHRSDFALGMLGPDVSAKYSGMTANSSGSAYYMPALGWLSKQGSLAYGVGLFAQGGMGTEYKGSSFMAAGSGEKVRSEVSVGRLILPIAYNVNPNVIVGGSIDYVWAGMDIKMALDAATLGGMMMAGLVDGSLTAALSGVGTLSYARFDFSDSSPFTGEAKGTGFGGKLGAVFRVSPSATIGATYHTKTSLSNLTSSDATMTASGSLATAAMPGKIKVKDFEWPATLGIGAAFNPTEGLMLVADVKRIMWADVMESFKMSFTADSGGDLNATLPQEWDDQTVVILGGAYKVNSAVTVRAGYNRASNPIPNTNLNALFPAIEETHITGGVGYSMNKASSVDFALSKGLEKGATNSGSTVKSTMSQLNWQVMYSHRY